MSDPMTIVMDNHDLDFSSIIILDGEYVLGY